MDVDLGNICVEDTGCPLLFAHSSLAPEPLQPPKEYLFQRRFTDDLNFPPAIRQESYLSLLSFATAIIIIRHYNLYHCHHSALPQISTATYSGGNKQCGNAGLDPNTNGVALHDAPVQCAQAIALAHANSTPTEVAFT